MTYKVRAQQAGQVSLIIVLIMVVLLTTGLSIASQTTQELFLAQQDAESTRVFNAAEAGIEQALSTDVDFAGDVTTGNLTAIDDVAVGYDITKQYTLEMRLFEGMSVETDVRGVAAGQGLRVEWSKVDDCGADDPASLLISIYSIVGGESRVRYQGWAACDRSDGFTLATSQSGVYRRTATIMLEPDDVVVHIKSLYQDTDVQVSGQNWTLPVQSYRIRSEAQSELGDETRIVEVQRTLPAPPSIFDYGLYSGTTIVK